MSTAVETIVTEAAVAPKRGSRSASKPVHTAVQTTVHKKNALDPRTVDTNALVSQVTGGVEISVNIPKDAKLPDVLHTLDTAIRGYQTLIGAAERLKPVIGRIIYEIQLKALYKPDYRNITDFIQKRVVDEMGLGRSTAFDALRVAKQFPTMTTEDYSRFGASRLLLAAKLDETDLGTMGYPDHISVLHHSLEIGVAEFAEEVKQTLASESDGLSALTLRVNKSTKTAWLKLVESTNMKPSRLLKLCMESYHTTHPTEKADTA